MPFLLSCFEWGLEGCYFRRRHGTFKPGQFLWRPVFLNPIQSVGNRVTMVRSHNGDWSLPSYWAACVLPYKSFPSSRVLLSDLAAEKNIVTQLFPFATNTEMYWGQFNSKRLLASWQGKTKPKKICLFHRKRTNHKLEIWIHVFLMYVINSTTLPGLILQYKKLETDKN